MVNFKLRWSNHPKKEGGQFEVNLAPKCFLGDK